LAERFGFVELLKSALEAPQRWLDHQRALRYRGTLRLYVPHDDEFRAARLTQAFCSDTRTWDGLDHVEDFAHTAACALFRLGEREYLLKRWTNLPDWKLPQGLLSDLSALTPSISFDVYDHTLEGVSVLNPTAAAEGLAWLAKSAEDRDLQFANVERALTHQDREPPRIEAEIKCLHALATDPRRMDVAAFETQRYLRLGGDTEGTSKRFWACASQPAEHDPPPDARLAAILVHALWLWAKPPLPAELFTWLTELEARLPRYGLLPRAVAPVASWQAHDDLQEVANARAAKAAGALLALGDNTPLSDWIAGLANNGDSNWFARARLDAVGKAVKGDEALAIRAFRYAVAHPGPVVRHGEVDADRVLHELEPSYPMPPRAAAGWVPAELVHAPTPVCWRLLKASRHEGDLRFLPVLRSVHAEAASFSEQMWYARRIHQLDRQDPSLAVGIKEWLGRLPRPFAGTASLDDAQWRENPVCGFEDFLALAGKLWRAGDLTREELRAGVHRLASLIPPPTPVADEGAVAEGDLDLDGAMNAARHERHKVEANNRSLGALPDKLLDLAVELEGVGLGEHINRVTGKPKEHRLGVLVPELELQRRWLADVQILDQEGELLTVETSNREQSAGRLAYRGLDSPAVRTFAEHRLKRLVAGSADVRDIAYVMEIFHRLGDEDWKRGLLLVPPDRRALVQAEALAMGWSSGRSAASLDNILMDLAGDSPADRM
jgi:hypothetical protein